MSDMNKKNDDNIGSFYMGRTRPPPKPKRQLPPGFLTAFAAFALGWILWSAYPRGEERYVDMEVPIVKADTFSIREYPKNPGGMEVPHRDSTVFDPLAKKPVGVVERLRPESEKPLDKETAIGLVKEGQSPSVIKMAPTLSLDLKMKDKKNGLEKTVPKAVPVKKKASSVAAVSGKKVYIQLGSYRKEAAVKKDWARLKKKYLQFLGDLTLKTERVDIPGKGVFYRLQMGKLTKARAQEICTALKTANSGGCILVK